VLRDGKSCDCKGGQPSASRPVPPGGAVLRDGKSCTRTGADRAALREQLRITGH